MTWSGDGRLLTLGCGCLTAWEVPAGKAVWEVEGGYAAPAELAPGRGWLAVSAGTYVDLIETTSGRCLGRCRTGGVDGTIRDVAVSPDGKRLAAVYPGAPARRKELFTAVVWDLTSGKAERVPFGTGSFALLHWGGPEQLVACSDRCELFDLRARDRVGTYSMPKNYDRPLGPPLARSPEGRLWISLGNTRGLNLRNQPRVWRALTVPDPRVTNEGRVLAEDRQYVSLRKTPVRVEVDLGKPERSRGVANILARGVREQGLTLGPDGWVLRMTHKVVDSEMVLQPGQWAEEGVKIPKVLFTLELLDPEGTQVLEQKSEGLFAQVGSKYYVKSVRGNPALGAQPGAKTDYYEFGKQGLRTAVVEEILDTRSAGFKIPAGSIPAWFLKSGGSVCTLPLTLELPGTLKP
jgi:hypothetical protein